jgi:long-chain acyl-CoA synthetase
MTVHWPIIKTLLSHPRKVVMIDDNRSYKGIEVLVAAMHMARHISRTCKTKHLGLLLPTGGAFPIAALGGWIAGKVIVPLNYLLKPEELKYVIGDCETDTIISAGPMLTFLGHRPEIPNLIEMDKLSFKISNMRFFSPSEIWFGDARQTICNAIKPDIEVRDADGDGFHPVLEAAMNWLGARLAPAA